MIIQQHIHIHTEPHRGVNGVPEEANHLGVRRGADQGHVAIPEGAIDLEVEAGFGRRVSMFSQGLNPISRQIKVEAMSTNLRSGHLSYRDGNKAERIEEAVDQACNKTHKITVMFNAMVWALAIYLLSNVPYIYMYMYRI